MIFLWQLENIRTPFFNEIMQFVTCFGQEHINHSGYLRTVLVRG